MEYNVVVFPDPVGPHTRIMPCGILASLWRSSTELSAKPSFDRSRVAWDLSSIRIQAFSPNAEGNMETRKSTCLPAMIALKRPSCGKRCSVISSSDMTFIRVIIGLCKFLGGDGSSWKTPSTLYLTLNFFSKGSIRISEAF